MPVTSCGFVLGTVFEKMQNVTAKHLLLSLVANFKWNTHHQVAHPQEITWC
jgi:hypothetical protein